jgi:uncharacterized protein YkwD
MDTMDLRGTARIAGILKRSVVVLAIAAGFASAREPAQGIPQTTIPAPPQALLQEGVALSSVEAALVASTNEARARSGLAPLDVDPQLMRSARSHARRMASSRSLVHGSGVTENIGMGQSTASEAVSDWMQSPGHRGNILDAGHGRIGVAVARATDGSLYWCQQFR